MAVWNFQQKTQMNEAIELNGDATRTALKCRLKIGSTLAAHLYIEARLVICVQLWGAQPRSPLRMTRERQTVRE